MSTFPLDFYIAKSNFFLTDKITVKIFFFWKSNNGFPLMALKLTYMWNIVTKLAKLQKSILSRVTPSITSSVSHILTHFFLAKNQKTKHLQFQIRISHGIRRSPHPFSSQSDTSFARYGHLSVEVWGKLTLAMVQQLSPNSIASRSPSRVPHREPQTTCAQKTLILYTASGYIDQQ